MDMHEDDERRDSSPAEVPRGAHQDPMRVSSMISTDATDLPREVYPRTHDAPRPAAEMDRIGPSGPPPLRPPPQWEYAAQELSLIHI